MSPKGCKGRNGSEGGNGLDCGLDVSDGEGSMAAPATIFGTVNKVLLIALPDGALSGMLDLLL